MDIANNNATQVQQSVHKDITSPSLASGDIGVPSNGHYIGGPLDFIVSFSENVVVNDENGLPRITLDIGGATQYAVYATGAGSRELTFRYIIQTGIQDDDGISIADSNSSIDLNGGVIEDLAGNYLTSTGLSIPGLLGVTVDGQSPTLDSVTAAAASDGNAYYRRGESITLTATFSEQVTITRTPELRLDVGGVQKGARYAGSSGQSATAHDFTYTISVNENDPDGISVIGINSHTTIVDDDSNNVAAELAPTLSITNVIVDTSAPIINGPENDANVRMDKSWRWECPVNDEAFCLFRFAINTEDSYQFGNHEQYQNVSRASAPGDLNGKYYVHIQAIDSAGNESPILKASVSLDNTAPVLLSESIQVPEDRIYATNEGLDFTVVFDENVWVDTANGNPRLILLVGDDTRYAQYLHGAETQELTFRYIAQMGDIDNDGITLSNDNRIDLNGGVIRDQANNPATLNALTISSLGEVKVNSIAPTLTSLVVNTSVMEDLYYKADEVVNLSATFSEEVTVMGIPELVLRLGNFSVMANYAGEEGASALTHDFTYTVGVNDNDSDGVFVTDI